MTDGAEVGASPLAEAVRSARESAAPESEKKGGSSTERVRAYRARQKQGAAASAPAPSPTAPPTPITQEEEIAAAGAFGFVWELAIMPMSGGRLGEMTEKQALRGGKALAPLVRKWLPLVAGWQAEITACIVIAGIVNECKREVPKPTISEEADPLGDIVFERPIGLRREESRPDTPKPGGLTWVAP